MSQEIPKLSDEKWAIVVKNAQTTCENFSIPWTGGDVDICGAYTILVETGQVESHEALRVVYELGRRSNADLLEAANGTANYLQGLFDEILEANEIEHSEVIAQRLRSLRAAITKTEGRA